MTLPVSGPLSFSDINLELAKILQPGRLADAPINFNEADVRWLANKVAAGEQVTIPGDFYGKGYFNVVPNSTTADEGPVPTTPPPITTTTAVPTTTTAEPPSGVITVTPFLWTWTISPPAPPAPPAPTSTTAAPTSTTAAPVTTTPGPVTTTPAPAGPTYAFDTVTNPIPASVNEDSNFTVRVNTTGVANGTNLSWAVSNTPGLNDIDQTTGTFAINGNTGTFSLTATADALTEPGTETFTITIYAGMSPVLTSNSITINDTSQTPAATTTTAAPRIVPSTLPGFGLWLGIGSFSGCGWNFRIFKNGTYEMEMWSYDFSDTYTDWTTGTTYSVGTGPSQKTGDWISPKSSSVGDSYWVRFTGICTTDLGWFSGYNYDPSITSEASPQIYTRSSPATNASFDSGWISLSSDRAISINSGGDSLGSYALVGGQYAGPRSPIRLRIASDASGANVLCDTLLGEYGASTSYAGGS